MCTTLSRQTAKVRKGLFQSGQTVKVRRLVGLARSSKALCIFLASLLPVFAPEFGHAAQALKPSLGEAYIFNHVADTNAAAEPGQGLDLGTREEALEVRKLLDPYSSLWAGAQSLRLNREERADSLGTNVIASSGDSTRAAASHPDGRITLFGLGNCSSVTMPGGHPAYALALAKNGAVLAAWAQGVNQLVFFSLDAPGCQANATEPALRGQLSLTLSSSGAFLAAQDESGKVWVGTRGKELRSVADLGGPPAAIGFSDGEGVLLVIDALGRGGAWNPRTGSILRTLEVPGGPFVRGDIQGVEARLWTANGKQVRWDALHNNAIKPGAADKVSHTAQNKGWLELRGTDLYLVRAEHCWRPKPLYEPVKPQLAASRYANCLRLSDVDGVVRYYDARTGSGRLQCFADDWSPVLLQTDGTAQYSGLRMRVFDRLETPGNGSHVNVRATSDRHVVLWTEAAPVLDLRVELPTGAKERSSRMVVEAADGFPQTLSVPLRQGLATDAEVQSLLLQ